MKKHPSSLNIVRWSAALLAASAIASTSLQANDEISIRCSPAVVNLESIAVGNCLTVHTDVPLSAVDTSIPITLNDAFTATSVFADNRGNLVAKFDLSELKETLTPPSITLTLTVTTEDGEVLSGSATVRVIQVSGVMQQPCVTQRQMQKRIQTRIRPTCTAPARGTME